MVKKIIYDFDIIDIIGNGEEEEDNPYRPGIVEHPFIASALNGWRMLPDEEGIEFDIKDEEVDRLKNLAKRYRDRIRDGIDEDERRRAKKFLDKLQEKRSGNIEHINNENGNRLDGRRNRRQLT